MSQVNNNGNGNYKDYYNGCGCNYVSAKQASEANEFDRDPSKLSVAIVTLGIIWFVVAGVVMPVVLIVERLIRYFK